MPAEQDVATGRGVERRRWKPIGIRTVLFSIMLASVVSTCLGIVGFLGIVLYQVGVARVDQILEDRQLTQNKILQAHLHNATTVLQGMYRGMATEPVVIDLEGHPSWSSLFADWSGTLRKSGVAFIRLVDGDGRDRGGFGTRPVLPPIPILPDRVGIANGVWSPAFDQSTSEVYAVFRARITDHGVGGSTDSSLLTMTMGLPIDKSLLREIADALRAESVMVVFAGQAGARIGPDIPDFQQVERTTTLDWGDRSLTARLSVKGIPGLAGIDTITVIPAFALRVLLDKGAVVVLLPFIFLSGFGIVGFLLLRRFVTLPAKHLREFARAIVRSGSGEVYKPGPVVEFNDVGRALSDTVRALAESEQRFRDFAAAASDWLWEADEGGRFTYVSRNAQPIFGTAARGALGRTMFEIAVDDQDTAEWQRYRERLRQRRSFRDLVFQYDSGDGRVHHIRASGRPVHDRNGNFRGYRGTGSDVTEETESKRRAEAAEKALRESREIETLGALTGGVAHDYNNMLGVIIGNLELLQDERPDNEEIQAAIEPALRAANRATEMTQRLLAFGRRQNLAPQRIDIASALREVEPLLRQGLGARHDLSIETEPDLWPCRIDPNQFEHMLVGLVVNGRDAMPLGGTLLIRAANRGSMRHEADGTTEPDEGDFVCLSIADSGRGIPQDEIERIFEPYFTTKGRSGHRGLGLSMVHGFVKQSGGHLTVESEVGRGSRFDIYLPRAA
ncbi:two-component system sensor histidine kinase NtrB [Oceanibacterium hippocampi]|uniref:histidine kinase n=1 Tax=Oceanibacterium hippocampi TaxID=745714 RepID=A0A1Y5RB53_9PROT|nr:ATP-binding protein [Oceanibacterium hippocampi]SLN12571.1 Blue-light-activated protein [Oceanibacterium hippocampi]